MVTTSQPLAAQAGLEILSKGGNAYDAAVAAAAVLNVVEPAPSGATPQHLAERGFKERMPMHGIDLCREKMPASAISQLQYT